MKQNAMIGMVAVAVCASIAAGEGLLWEDWDRRQVCTPVDYSMPTDEADLIAMVRAAFEAKQILKVVGAGHSFSAIALTSGHMISLDKMNAVLRVEHDNAGTTVSVQGGIRLHDLNAELEQRGFSLSNSGATCEQSIAGATATGTHGTGRLLGSMSTQIDALRIVLANGTAVDVSANSHLELFNAARVGLGALGIVSEITLRVLPLFYLRLNNTIMPLDDLLKDLPDLMQRYERLQWFWLPPDEQHATLVTREVVKGPPSTTEQAQGCWNPKQFGQHGEPALFFGQSAAPTHTSCTDVAYKALCGSPAHYAARHLYTEMEMFVPIAEVGEAIDQFRKFQASVLPQHNGSISLFTGVRYVQADDILLSPQHGRDNAVISFIVMGDSKTQTGDFGEFSRYAQHLEDLTTKKFNGRPHWGKMNWATADTLAPSYGSDAWARFQKVRAAVDPTGMFANDYLQSHIGSTSH
jgi:L-gulonolactone oxidase